MVKNYKILEAVYNFKNMKKPNMVITQRNYLSTVPVANMLKKSKPNFMEYISKLLTDKNWITC